MVNGRSGGTVIESPTSSDNFTLIVEFNDTGRGEATYTSSIGWTP